VYNSPEITKYYGSGNGLKKWLYPRIQQFVISRADALKCLFKQQLEGFNIPKSIIVSDFFDYTPIESKEYVNINSKIILSIGFPSYIKGMDILVDAFARLSDKYPDWELWIVGWMTFSEKEELSKLAKNNKNIKIMNPVDFSQIPELIDNCEIFVLASRTEAMGRVLIESMARSKARVGSNVDGIPTVINNNVDGMLFEKGNVNELMVKLSTLMSSESMRKDLAVAAYKRFRAEFTIKEYSFYIRQLYGAIMSKE
jgi:glycosyltransferase involved in cell wall biosynthesis